MEKRRRLTPVERRAVYDKMGGRCAYCGEQLNYEDMQVDHVVALRSKGEDDLANMLPACRSCNHYKRGNSLEGWRRILEAMPATLERDCYTYRQAVRFGISIWAVADDFSFKRHRHPAKMNRRQFLNETPELNMLHIRLINTEPLVLLIPCQPF